MHTGLPGGIEGPSCEPLSHRIRRLIKSIFLLPHRHREDIEKLSHAHATTSTQYTRMYLYAKKNKNNISYKKRVLIRWVRGTRKITLEWGVPNSKRSLYQPSAPPRASPSMLTVKTIEIGRASCRERV